MELRLASMDDLPRLTGVYGKIVGQMDQNGVRIWDEVYPCAFFREDIESGRLYVLTDGEELVSAFALCASEPGAASFEWEEKEAKAFYISRLGVNTAWLRRGIGGLMLEKAAALAGEKGAAWLRLLVVDGNEPAVRLYRKSGFRQAAGSYDQIIEGGPPLHELGFERKTRPAAR